MPIRIAEERDAEGLAHIVVTTYRVAHRDHLPPDYLRSSLSRDQSARNWRRTLRAIRHDRTTRERVIVRDEDDGRPIGVAMGGPDRPAPAPATPESDSAMGGLYILYILPEHQRRGLGRLLVGAVAEWLLARGFSGMRVRVLRENLPARRFYETLGGVEIGTEAHTDGGIVLNEVVYEWANLYALRSR